MAKKAKTTPDLPGVEGPGISPIKIPSIARLANAYVAVRDERMELLQEEVKRKRALAAEMHKHEEVLKDPDGVLRYDHDGVIVMISPGDEKLTVKSPRSVNAEED